MNGRPPRLVLSVAPAFLARDDSQGFKALVRRSTMGRYGKEDRHQANS